MGFIDFLLSQWQSLHYTDVLQDGPKAEGDCDHTGFQLGEELCLVSVLSDYLGSWGADNGFLFRQCDFSLFTKQQFWVITEIGLSW